jgi:hypothetical protein
MLAIGTVNRFHEHQRLPNFTDFVISLCYWEDFILSSAAALMTQRTAVATAFPFSAL